MPWNDPGDGTFPSLGPLIADFIEATCVVPDGNHQGRPFRFTPRQYEFIVWGYRIHPDADPTNHPSRAFVFDRGMQYIAQQKEGKAGLSAALIVAEAAGPVIFDGWDANGQPVGRPWATPWIQVAAASEDQAANIWRALIPMIEYGTIKADISDVGETRINLPNRGLIEPVTSSARSRLGQRLTFAAQDETHSWNETNRGTKLADTQRRNLAGMGGRFLETGNAWDPSENSVAQTTFEKESGIHKLLVEGGPGSIRNKTERMRVLRQLYEGSPWVDPERVSSEIDSLLERGEYAQAERFFFNRIVPGEDRAFDVSAWERQQVKPYEPERDRMITIGVDGARYFDAVAAIATDQLTGYQWPLIILERPANAPDDYEHDMQAVDGAVSEAFKTYDVWRMYVDPGSQFANIGPLMETWQGRWTDKRVIAWPMTRPKPTAYMIRNFASAIITGDLTHPGDHLFTRHVLNARRAQLNVYDEDGLRMWTIQKETPRSPNKIDAAAAAALSWEARGDSIAAGAAARKRDMAYANPATMCDTCRHQKRVHRPRCIVKSCDCRAYIHQGDDGQPTEAMGSTAGS